MTGTGNRSGSRRKNGQIWQSEKELPLKLFTARRTNSPLICGWRWSLPNTPSKSTRKQREGGKPSHVTQIMCREIEQSHLLSVQTRIWRFFELTKCPPLRGIRRRKTQEATSNPRLNHVCSIDPVMIRRRQKIVVKEILNPSIVYDKWLR